MVFHKNPSGSRRALPFIKVDFLIRVLHRDLLDELHRHPVRLPHICYSLPRDEEQLDRDQSPVVSRAVPLDNHLVPVLSDGVQAVPERRGDDRMGWNIRSVLIKVLGPVDPVTLLRAAAAGLLFVPVPSGANFRAVRCETEREGDSTHSLIELNYKRVAQRVLRGKEEA